jgi:hypothetical protein
MVAAMVEANGGVVSSEIQARAEAEGVADALNKVGPAGERAGAQAAAGMDKLAQATAGANAQLQQQILMTERLRHGRPGEHGQPPTGSNKSDYDPGYGSPYSRPGEGPVNGLGETKDQYDRRHRLEGQNAVDNTLIFKLEEKLNAGTLTEADRHLVEAVKSAVNQNAQIARDASPGLLSTDLMRSLQQQQVLVQRMTDFLDAKASSAPAKTPATAPAPAPVHAPAPTPVPAPGPQQTRVATVHQVRIEGLGSAASVINTASEADARAVVDALRAASLRSSAR